MATIVRDPNTGVGQSYNGVALGQLGYNLKDINDDGLLQKVIIDSMTLKERNRYALAKMLLFMSNKSMGVEAARAYWTAGDENLSTTTVAAACNTLSATHIKLGLQNLQSGNRVRILCLVSTYYYEIELKLTSAWTANGYTFEQISFRTTHASATSVTIPTTATVEVMTNTQKLDDKSPAPTTRFPKVIGNYFERVRESVVIGTHTMADKSMIMDRSMEHQMNMKYYELIERLNYALYFKNAPIDPALSTDNSGEFGGLQYFFNNFDRDASIEDIKGNATGMKGINTVMEGTSISRSTFEDALIPYMNYGTDKWLFANPRFITKIFRAMFGTDAVMNYEKFSLNRSDKIWDGIPVELATGTIWLMPDHSLTGRKVYIEDNVTDTTLSYSGTDWGVIIDAECTDILYSDVPDDGGIQTLAPRDVMLEGGTSNTQREWNTQLSLMVKRPETGGFICLNGES
jgi:hypothetical protein